MTQFLDLPDGRIAYDDTGGEGTMALCVPGIGDVRSQYRILAPRLVAAGYRVVTMDIRGHGESSAEWPSYTAADVADDALALLHAEAGGKPAVVIGNSMAAASAIRMAALEPQAVWALVFLGPVARDNPMSDFAARTFSAFVSVAFAGPWGPAAWGVNYRRLYPTYSTEHQPADLRAHVAKLVRNLAEPGRLAALRKFLLASKADCTQLVADVHAPVLAIMGTEDPDVPDPAAELDWLELAVGARTLLVDGVGHYPHVEDPKVTGDAVVAFLAGV